MATSIPTHQGPAVPEGGRRPTGGTAGVPSPPTEVTAPPHRRYHTVAYKQRVLETVRALRRQGNGGIGAFLRSEGLYSSAVQKWERQQAAEALTTTIRGPKAQRLAALREENKRLHRQVAQLEQRLQKTELIVDLQKKLSTMLEAEPSSVTGVDDAP